MDGKVIWIIVHSLYKTPEHHSLLWHFICLEDWSGIDRHHNWHLFTFNLYFSVALLLVNLTLKHIQHTHGHLHSSASTQETRISKPSVARYRQESSRITCWFDLPPLRSQLILNNALHHHYATNDRPKSCPTCSWLPLAGLDCLLDGGVKRIWQYPLV